jgi:hypothetical protein
MGPRRSWPSRRLIVGISGTLLVVQLLVLGFLVAGSYGLVRRYGPDTVSFVSFYAAGQLADRGFAPLVYDEPILGETEEDLTHPGTRFIPFLYPPVYLLLCAPLAWLPPLAALAMFEAATLLLYLGVVRRILDASGWQWMLPALAFPPVFWTLGYGQNAFLTAALFGGATLLIDRRPAAAGVLFGALCFKPHFLLLVPVALLAGRRWSVIASAVATVVLLTALSILVFGLESWHAYLRQGLALNRLGNFAIDRVSIFASISPFAGARLVGLGNQAARFVQFVATAGCVLLVAWVWRKPTTLRVRAATLAAATLIAVPYALLYDLMLAAIAGAWLLRERATNREVLGLAAVYALPLFAFQLSLLLKLPMSPLASCILLLLGTHRALGERRDFMSSRGPVNGKSDACVQATGTLTARRNTTIHG